MVALNSTFYYGAFFSIENCMSISGYYAHCSTFFELSNNIY